MNRQRFQTLMDYQMSFPLYTKRHLTMHGDRAVPGGKRRDFSTVMSCLGVFRVKNAIRTRNR